VIPAPGLSKPVQYLKGVGPRRAQALKNLGIETVGDLLNHFPREHEDRTEKVPIGKAQPGAECTLQGKVEGFEVLPAGKNLAVGKALLKDETGYIWAVWFRRTTPRYDVFESLSRQLSKGAVVMVHGPVERNFHEMQVRVDEHEVVGGADAKTLHVGRLVPVYPLTDGVDARWLRELVWDVLQEHGAEVRDYLPSAFLEKHRLAALPWAVQRIHFPTAWTDRDQARRRLAFEEFFFLELALGLARGRREEGPPAAPCTPTREHLTPFRATLGFELTRAQKHVINEIFADMARPKPMSRLLQGDVGSGKTVVALSAMLLAVENGRQAALMAPTEILAEQHFLTLHKFLGRLPLRWGVFTRDLKGKRKAAQLEELRSGKMHIAVGTHALIQEDVEFHKLGLVVIDEQHRFGVRQRAQLQLKGEAAHVLIMTATPIPRTLALTFYGDLSASVIDELPPGRPALTTHWTLEDNALAAVRRAVEQGRQAYVVYPLVDESDKLDLLAAVHEWERLRTAVFPDRRVGLLHGRMKSAEKEDTMSRFVAGDLDILVATPVVEVGIDVANATVMVVMNADRFGLSQLHQLRGRVGRGVHPSACYLVSDPKSQDAAHRMRLICANVDGFKLAEEDLKLRGPGEFLGENQHGLPPFKVGDLVKDGPLIEEAREAAFGLLQTDAQLESPELQPFADELKRRFAGKLQFGQVA
jgi:ATP-dependent DNA helicase RecG